MRKQCNIVKFWRLLNHTEGLKVGRWVQTVRCELESKDGRGRLRSGNAMTTYADRRGIGIQVPAHQSCQFTPQKDAFITRINSQTVTHPLLRTITAWPTPALASATRLRLFGFHLPRYLLTAPSLGRSAHITSSAALRQEYRTACLFTTADHLPLSPPVTDHPLFLTLLSN